MNLQYAIQPFGKVTVIYVSKFQTFNEAVEAARSLAEEHKVEVMISKVIGYFKPTIIWDSVDPAYKVITK